MLSSVDLQLVNDVSKQPIGPISKDQGVQDTWHLKMGPMLSWNVGK